MNNESQPSSVETAQLQDATAQEGDAQLTHDAAGDGASVPPGLEPNRLKRALERNRALIEAVPASQVVDIRTDVAVAAMRVLRVVCGWSRLRPRIAALIASEARFAASSPRGWCTGWPDTDPVEMLVSLAEANLQANADYLVAAPSTTGRPYAPFKRASKLRTQFIAEIKVLQQRQLLPQGALRGLRRTKGYGNVALDLAVLVALLEAHWQSICAKCAITRDDLVTGEQLAQELAAEAYEPRVRALRREDATLFRARAFTLMLRAYDDLRGCIRFLEPAAYNDLAPSLYKGRGRRAAGRRKAQVDAEQCSVPPTQPTGIEAEQALDEPIVSLSTNCVTRV